MRSWLADFGQRAYTTVERTALDRLDGWECEAGTGNLRHHSGKFFQIQGLEVHAPGGPVEQWHQPIIRQPEVGILGILVKEFDGIPYLLMQAKVEPGNRNGLQLAPTVQATRSNYLRVHGGRPVPYLDYFRQLTGRRVIADVRQSEQGSWFLGKRNRNMVVEVADEVEVLDGFRWFTLGQVHRLLAADDVINMDARTVLSCLPYTGGELAGALGAHGYQDGAGDADGDADGFRASLVRSCAADQARHSTAEILSWITDTRALSELHTRSVPLDAVTGWRRTDGGISHESGNFFRVMGVTVTAGGREVAQWSQPMIEPCGTGVIAFVVRRFAGVLHVLVRIRAEPGFVDVAELGPTVQCTPQSYARLPRPRLLDVVLEAAPEQIRFDTMLSEEGGRFYHALNRYLIVEAEVEEDSPEFRWLTLSQLSALLRHSNYLNVQARSLVACLHSLSGQHPQH
ncbi:NDP-hexose 2,3-dehydratase family protein [Streptomyces sp. N2-109]|uniref:NDP-hexose 2,3-dehydratase family protein n=1 Tax=Streptomyces gossypii TaxID=2883101 RepID=A0ABT2JNX5_9ACTN|nr:NDP-hexose 2,3-dehydratase family protein [Streptomyces gossypii]